MTCTSIKSNLLLNGIGGSDDSAEKTAGYAIHWMLGGEFDFQNSLTKLHRSRLCIIGIDIRTQYVQAQS